MRERLQIIHVARQDLEKKQGRSALTRQELGHIAPVVAEAKVFSPVLQTPVADTTVSSREEKRNATRACRNQINARTGCGTEKSFLAYRVVRNCCKPVLHMKWEL